MKIFKKLLLVVGILIALIIIAGLFLPAFIDVNNYKDKIEQLAEQSIGRKLTLDGDLELKTFPNLRVKTGAVSLANPEGFPHKNMLEVSSAEIGIRLLPLILKKVEAGTIKFDSPVINLTKKSTGEANWTFQFEDEDNTEQTEADSSGTALAAIAVQGFEITNAKINYADLVSDTIVSVNNLNLTTGTIIPDTSFPVEITSAISGSMLADPIELELATQANINAELDTFGLNELSSVIKQADKNYEINVPNLKFGLKSNQLLASGLTLHSNIDAQSQANVTAETVEVDLDKVIAKVNSIKASVNATDLDVNVDLPGVSFDINEQVARLDAVKLTLNNPQLSASLNLPEKSIDLGQSEFGFENISGDYQFKNLDGQLAIADVSINKDTLELQVNGAQIQLDNAKITSDISGIVSPAALDFTVSSNTLNLKEILATLETPVQTSSASALTSLDLDLHGSYTENVISVEKFSGILDKTNFEGSAFVKDFTNPAIKINLTLGELEVDDYLPNSNDQDNNAAGKTAAAAAGSPVALSQFNLVASIKAQRINSVQNQITLEDIDLNLTPSNDKSAISFKSLISGAGLPEPINLKLDTLALIDNAKSTAQLSALNLTANGKTINAGLSIPQANIPFSADEIKLENLTANFSNAIANSELKIPDLNFNSSSSSLIVKNITGTGTFNEMNARIILPNLSVALDNQSLKLNELSLDLSGTKPVGRLSIPTLDVNLATQALGPTNILFEGQDGRAELTLKPSTSNGVYSGNLVANDFNLRGILNRFNLMTDLSDKNALTRVNIQSPINFSDSKLKLENIKARIDDTTISGFIDAHLGLNPVYNFSINVGDLNADRYIPAATEGESSNSTKAVAAPVAIPVELFKQTTADGKVHFDSLQIGGAQFTNFDIGVKSKDGKLSISPIQSGFFDGQMDGNLAVNSATQSPRLDFDYTLSKVALEPALSSLGVTDKLAGNGNFSLTMGAAGKTDKAMISSVAGNASLAVNNGAIKGVNLQDILFKGYQAYAALKDKTVNSKYNPSDQTEFSSMTGTWTINSGIIAGNDLQIQAPLFRINGTGKVSLIENTIDYVLSVKVVKSLEGQGGKSMKELEGRTIPLSITGSLTNPQYNLDISSLVKAEAQRKAEEKIEEKIEEKLGEKLEGEGTLQEKLQKKAVEKVGEKLLDLFN